MGLDFLATPEQVREFIERHGKPYDPATDTYDRPPFASDTRAGKNDPIYNAHPYHTKVPPRGIVPYIEHYAGPADIVLDPFCGSGMTGIACLLARDRNGGPAPRRAILNDLSPAACHIAYNYCTPVDVPALRREFERIRAAVMDEFDWLYRTTHDDGTPATIQYTIWSDRYRCEGLVKGKPRGCGVEIVLWDVAVDRETGQVRERFRCSGCGEEWRKTQLKRTRSVPVVTNYEYVDANGKRRRAERPITDAEKARIAEIESKPIPYWYPTVQVEATREMYIRSALHLREIKTVADFYTKRNLWALARLCQEIGRASIAHQDKLRFVFTGIALAMSRLNRFRPAGTSFPYNVQSGTLYLPALQREHNVLQAFHNKLYLRLTQLPKGPTAAILTMDHAGGLRIPENSVDYIFTDPPFGSNIFYGDCSLLWEAWLVQFTDDKYEAVWNKSRKPEQGGKTLDDYARLMKESFQEMYRVLKPGRWASVVFNNSDDNVFEAIKQGARDAGFSIENVLFFDKVQKTFKGIKGEKGEKVTNCDVVMNLLKGRVAGGGNHRQIAEDVERLIIDRILEYLRELPARIKDEPQTYTDEHRTTPFLHSMLMRAQLPTEVSLQGITLQTIENVCARYLRKVDNQWYLRSEPVRVLTAEGRLELLTEPRITDERTAIEWIRFQLLSKPQRINDLIPKWQQATATLLQKLPKTLEDYLREFFWFERATGRYQEPTPEQREKMADERTLQVLHDAERFLAGTLKRAVADVERCEWIGVCYRAGQGYEDLNNPDEAKRCFGVASRLWPTIIKDSVDSKLYATAQKQAQASTRRLTDDRADAGAPRPAQPRRIWIDYDG